jgi:hypothetical protein
MPSKMHLIKIPVSSWMTEIVEDPHPDSLFEAPSWRNPPKPLPLTSSTPPPDDNPTRGICHLEVAKVDDKS